MDDLATLRVFVQVVEDGSLSAAARRAQVAVSSIARQVKALEDSLGARLLNKTTRRQSLTEAGRVFFERAKLILDEYDRARRDVSSYQSTVKGVLRVYLRTSAATALIVPALPRFLERNPNVAVDVTLGDERIDLIAQGMDVAVFLGHLDDSTMVARRLAASQRVVCGSPAYFKRHGRPQAPADLARHNCLIYKAHAYSDLWRFVRGTEKINVPVTGNLHTSSATALMAAGLAGLGVMVVQRWMAAAAIAEGTLTAVLNDYDVSPTDRDTALYAVYPGSRGLSPKARAFVDFLVDLFKRQG